MKSTKQNKIRIWHPLIRIIHWWLVAVFVTNYFIIEPGSQVHQWLGYSAVGLLLVRICWGFIDNGFGSFSKLDLSPRAFREHFAHLRERKIPAKSGHNPIGWLMIFLIIILFIGQGVTGFMMEEVDAFFGNSTLEFIHGWTANLIYAAALIHIAAVFFVAWWGRIQLVRPMITGKRER